MEELIKLISELYVKGKITDIDKNELMNYINTNPKNISLLKQELEKLLDKIDIETIELDIINIETVDLNETTYKITTYSDNTISVTKNQNINPINLYNFKNPLNQETFKNLNDSQKEQIYLIDNKYQDKIILSNPIENIHIIPDEKLILTVENKDGIYQIKKLNQINEFEGSIENNKLNKKTNQKTLGTHPGMGQMFKSDEDGFSNIILMIFLAGITIGMIAMLGINILM